MNKYPNTVMETLCSLIREMAENPMLYVKNPGKDFTRDRKLPFETVVSLLISMGGNSLYKELLDSLGYDVNTATSSAFVQQREKILPCAFEFLLHGFTRSHSELKRYRGYRLFANDGSALHIATNPNDADTYFQNNPEEKGFNLLHLNAMYDLCNRIYVDSLIQPGRQQNEHKALVDMVGRSHVEEPVIIIGDRLYESYNNFAHIEKKGWKYLIRVKDLGSNGILSGLQLPSGGDFDIMVQRILTRKQTKQIKARPDLYRFLPKNSTFDFLDLLCKKDILFVFPMILSNTSTRLVLKTPKTESSVRKVWLPKTLAYILREWKKSQDELKEFLGNEYADYNLVIALPNGRPCENRILHKEFEALREEAGLPHVVFHSLRHSSTTYKLKLNHGDLKATQGDTGHAQIDMITDVYSHILDEDRKINAQKFEAAFYSNPDLRDVRPPTEANPGIDLQALLVELQNNPTLAATLAQILTGKSA